MAKEKNILKEKPNPIDVDKTSVIDLKSKDIKPKDDKVSAIALIVLGILLIVVGGLAYFTFAGLISWPDKIDVSTKLYGFAVLIAIILVAIVFTLDKRNK